MFSLFRWTAFALLLAGSAAAQAPAGSAVVIDIEGAIGTSTADYVIDAIDEAVLGNARVIILRIDTPGGFDRAMREIISKMLASPVPVVAWVGPAGARADSAGTFIVYAAHVATMAETTHLGAATPVNLIGGEEPDPTPPTAGDALEEAEPNAEPADEALPGTAMERKVLNDAVAYIRGLAETRGRNADWAEAAVREAATLTASNALEENVIDLIARDIPSLLAALDGREVTLDTGSTVTLATNGIAVEVAEPNWRQKFLGTITSPEVAILLLFAGIYGLIFEGWNPGSFVPGIVGAICLLLAAYALNVMDVNYAGIGLIILGIILITAEVFVPSFGALGIGGVISIIIGAIMAFDSGIPGYEVSRWFVGLVAASAGTTIFFTGYFAARLMRRGAVSGREQILKSAAVAVSAFDGNGTVLIQGERWAARSRTPVEEGQTLRVVGINGLVLDVEPADGASEHRTE
ncbi:MAG: nodulation protein NfeD [Pseudomonadota bacterium]